APGGRRRRPTGGARRAGRALPARSETNGTTGLGTGMRHMRGRAEISMQAGIGTFLIATFLGAGTGSALAQSIHGSAPVAADETVGTIVIAHGGSEEWNAPVLRIAAAAPTGGPVEVSFLMGD